MANDYSFDTVATRGEQSVLATNKVLRNTYALLAMTLLFSAGTAALAMTLNLPHPGLIISLVVMFGGLFAINALRNSVWALPVLFAWTGFLGMTLGPLLNMYIQMYSNGTELIMMAMGGTGVTFLGLSAYVLTTRKDFSFMRGMLMAGMIVAVLAMVGLMFFPVPAASLAISAVVVMLMSGFILYDTSNIIHGYQTNYILATVGLYLNIYNLFIHLLSLMAAFSGDD
ncbi:MAG: BAX inhibitor (BI)-1/YccA family protein [Gammaproteobacteria bacterium]|nr:MAG: BAX inhibitor (BI)-1/YccA family protein [Gammaproteobacteria bacterium]RLA11870.1 MAG: BAX inhibitor (BI)-1/YccA family protein [Gammaproteobacteria bacterium]RLA12046.1 MAG: BAX inhibitor (BI)-1/YccA family protein [Gammaproteobacteria bacterium]